MPTLFTSDPEFFAKDRKNALNFNNKKKFSKKLPLRVWDKKGLPRLF